jgi:hypothetical protein
LSLRLPSTPPAPDQSAEQGTEREADHEADPDTSSDVEEQEVDRDSLAVLGDEDDRGDSGESEDDQPGLVALWLGRLRALPGTDVSLLVYLDLLSADESLADQDSADAYSDVSSPELLGTT